MLQKIRDNAHGWWTWLFVPLLIVLFAFWGIGNYIGGGLSQNEVAKVNGESISAATFSSLYSALNNAKNPNQNPGMSQTLKMQVLQNLVNKLLLNQSLTKLGFSISTATVNQLIYQIPAFQQNGQFSMPLYQHILQNIGQTTASLKADLSTSYVIDQFQNGLTASSLALPTEIIAETQYSNMLKDVDYITVPMSTFISKAPPSATDISTYYTAHQNAFMTPLQVKLAYVELSMAQFQKATSSEDAAAQYSAALNQMANLAFQNSDSLTPISQAFHIPVQTTALLDTSHPTDILAQAAVLQAVNNKSILQTGSNSSVINISPTEAVVIRVVTSVPQSPLPLAQVQSQIIMQIQSQAAEKEAEKTFSSIINAVNQGGNFKNIAQAYGFRVQTATGISSANQDLAPQVINMIAALGVGQASATPTANGSFTLATVVKAYPNPQPTTTLISKQNIQNLWLQIELGQYLSSLQNQAKIKVNQALVK